MSTSEFKWRKGIPHANAHAGTSDIKIAPVKAVASKPQSSLPRIQLQKRSPKPAVQPTLVFENRMPEKSMVKIIFHMPDKSKVDKQCPGSILWANLRDYCAEHLRGKQTNYEIPRNVRLTRKTNSSSSVISEKMLEQRICECISAECKVVHMQVQCG
jgi:hypothetical protein